MLKKIFNVNVWRHLISNVLAIAFCICLVISAWYGGYFYGYQKATRVAEKSIESKVNAIWQPMDARISKAEATVDEMGIRVAEDAVMVKRTNDFLVERFNIWQWERPDATPKTADATTATPDATAPAAAPEAATTTTPVPSPAPATK